MWAGGPPRVAARVGGCRRRTAVSASGPPRVPWCARQPQSLHCPGRRGGGLCERPGFRCAPTRIWASSPLRSVAGCWVLPVRRRAPARHHLCVYDVFCGCPADHTVPLRLKLLTPSFLRGPAALEFFDGAPASLISFRRFPAPCPGGRSRLRRPR
uniref:Uncharacterized protein n=1 Tax=Arthrobacter sp. Chr15 TaxID=447032 RepID=A6YFS5_9MICC|nr:unknown [Arthrobacter sp. Chr15]